MQNDSRVQLPIACGVVIHEDRVLMVLRRDSELSEAHGVWELPGGKIEFGETSVQAAVREVYEETGFRVEAGPLLPVCHSNVWNYPDRQIQVFLLCHICRLIEDSDGETEISDSFNDPRVMDVNWLTLEEIRGLPTIDGTDSIIDALSNHVGFQRSEKKAAASSLPTGKLSPEILDSFLGAMVCEANAGNSDSPLFPPPRDTSMVIGPANGEDSAVLKAGDGTIVVTTDPITFSTSRLADYCVSVNANDIAASGALPAFMTVVLLIPSHGGWTESHLQNLALELGRCCRSRGITVVGGHTEVTEMVNSPVMVGQMIGVPGPCGIIGTSTARAGDALLLTKWAGIEGTAIIAGEKGSLLEKFMGSDFVGRAASFLDDPGISVLADSMALTQEFARDCGAGVQCPLHAMHDVTEGGVATGAWEMASASGVGVRVYADRVPLLPETNRICSHFGLDFLGLISSGSLLVALAPAALSRAISCLEEAGINATHIGDFTENCEYVLIRNGESGVLPRFHSDEVIRAMKFQA